jgi:hypothetical protein
MVMCMVFGSGGLAAALYLSVTPASAEPARG